MFSNGACYRQESAKGERHGFARRPQRNAERPARPKHAEFTILIQWRHVAHDHGAAWPARLEGIQAYERQPERQRAPAAPGTDADASPPAGECRRWWWPRRPVEGRPWRPARGRRG